MTFSRFVMWEAVVYAALLGVGGVVGWTKKKSQASLIAGLVSCLVISLTVFMGWDAIELTNTPFLFLAVYALTLMTVFFNRYVSSGRKFMPAGLMTLGSAGSFLLYLTALIVV